MKVQEGFESNAEQNLQTNRDQAFSLLDKSIATEAMEDEIPVPISRNMSCRLKDYAVDDSASIKREHHNQTSIIDCGSVPTIVAIEPVLGHFIDCYFEGSLPNQWKKLPNIQETTQKSRIEEVAEMKSLDKIINRLKEKKKVIERFFVRQFRTLKRSTKEEKDKQVDYDEKIELFRSLIEERIGQIKELSEKVKFYDQLEAAIITQTKELQSDFQEIKLAILTAHFKIRQNLEQIIIYAEKQKRKIDKKLHQQWRYFGKEQLYYDRDNLEILECYVLSLIPEFQKDVNKIGEVKLSTK